MATTVCTSKTTILQISHDDLEMRKAQIKNFAKESLARRFERLKKL